MVLGLALQLVTMAATRDDAVSVAVLVNLGCIGNAAVMQNLQMLLRHQVFVIPEFSNHGTKDLELAVALLLMVRFLGAGEHGLSRAFGPVAEDHQVQHRPTKIDAELLLVGDEGEQMYLVGYIAHQRQQHDLALVTLHNLRSEHLEPLRDLTLRHLLPDIRRLTSVWRNDVDFTCSDRRRVRSRLQV